ncbi:MAG: hypothetical protein Kow002_11630 [Anaerolineales bacterium]
MTPMRSILNRKNLVLLFSVIALGVLVVLASGVRDLEFQPGAPFALEETRQQETERQLNPAVGIALAKQVGFWIVVSALVVLISFMFVPELRKRLLRLFLNIGLTLFILSYLYENRMLSLPGFGAGDPLNTGQNTGDAGGELLPPPAFVAPDESSMWSYIISLGLLLSFLISSWFLFRWWTKLRAPVEPPDALPDLAAIARRSLKDISSGREWQGVIQECYGRMSDAVDRKRGLQREQSMTTGEFAAQMEQAGLPSHSVRRLTRLFEKVRYGGHKTDTSDVDEAVACLTDILHACGESV